MRTRSGSFSFSFSNGNQRKESYLKLTLPIEMRYSKYNLNFQSISKSSQLRARGVHGGQRVADPVHTVPKIYSFYNPYVWPSILIQNIMFSSTMRIWKVELIVSCLLSYIITLLGGGKNFADFPGNSQPISSWHFTTLYPRHASITLTI